MANPAVIIGEKEALERLRACLSTAVASGIDFRSPESLLVPYDLQTREGEASRREMERLYASLRNRLVVRLVVENLNPEAVAEKELPPLQRVCEQWAEIRRRFKELLNDRSLQGMRFVTVVVAEEGEWLPTLRPALESLAGDSFSSGADAEPVADRAIASQRCYLLTRLLELGDGEVYHAHDAWPRLVAGLLQHLLLMGSGVARDGRNQSGVGGLYAWRTARIVAGVDPQMLLEETQRIFAAVNRHLLQPPEEAPFNSPIGPPSTPESEPFAPPEPVSAALSMAAGRDWRGVDERTVDEEFAPATSWLRSTRAFAQRQRKQCLKILFGDANHPEVTRVEAAYGEADSRGPAALFPGHMASVELQSYAADAVSTIRNSMGVADAAEERLRKYAHQQSRAARAFVTTGERALIGVIVGMAWVYGVVATFVVAEKILSFMPFGWVSGAVVAAAGLSGILGMLVLGYVLQRWRGEFAMEQGFAVAAADYVAAQSRVREYIGAAMRLSAETNRLRARAAYRQVMHQRLARLEAILQNELQGGSVTTTGTRQEDQEAEAQDARIRRLVEREVRESGSGLDPDTTKKLIQQAIDDFINRWRAILTDDAKKRGFLPVRRLLELCVEHEAALKNDVENALRAEHLREMADKLELSKAAIKKEIDKLEAAKSTNYFSVDLEHGYGATHRIWVDRRFDEAIPGQASNKDSVDADVLGTGVLAHWHAEIKLVIETAPDVARLRFVVQET